MVLLTCCTMLEKGVGVNTFGGWVYLLRPLFPSMVTRLVTTPSTTRIYYTRCPVPTAAGIAFQRRMFDPVFAGSGYEVHDIRELGPAHRDAHYTHSIENFFREGGGGPPIWARANGVDSALLGITFMEEVLGIFVRADDLAESMTDLAGRRFALPVWPRLVFNFWRFAAWQGIASALRVHAMAESDVRFVDVTEPWSPHERRNVRRSDAPPDSRCEYRNQLKALVEGEVDAIFGKGPEVALLEREAKGQIRLLYDLRSAPSVADRVNNSTPRLLTTSRALVEEHPEAVIRYVQTLIRAARWARDNQDEAGGLIARECSVQTQEVPRYLETDYAEKLLPAMTDDLLETVTVVKAALYERAFIGSNFALDEWIAPEPLVEANQRESLEKI